MLGIFRLNRKTEAKHRSLNMFIIRAQGYNIIEKY